MVINLIIRQENEKEYKEVYSLIRAAFFSAEHSDGNEQDLVDALRNSTAFIPQLSLVAEQDGRIVGHILFTKAAVGGKTVLALAPLSVLPEYQRRGIGSALIKKGHETAASLGYEYALVLGSDKYYPKFGYVPAAGFGIEVPDGMPPSNFMAVKLKKSAGKISGGVKYADEFGI